MTDPAMKMMRSWRMLSALILSLLAGGCMRAYTQIKVPQVFSEKVIEANIPAELQRKGVRRVRPVEINLDLFAGTTPITMKLNFFTDAELNVEWTRVERVQGPAGMVWTGTVVGFSTGQANIVVSGRNVTGNITRGDGVMYQVRTMPDGRWWVLEIDQKEFPGESPPIVPGRG